MRGVPATPCIECTVPAVSASTAISIFMASMITSVSPFSTACPAATLICQTLPETGDVMATQSSGSAGASARTEFSTIGVSASPAARQRSRSASKALR